MPVIAGRLLASCQAWQALSPVIRPCELFFGYCEIQQQEVEPHLEPTAKSIDACSSRVHQFWGFL